MGLEFRVLGVDRWMRFKCGGWPDKAHHPSPKCPFCAYMSYSLNSLKGHIQGIIYGITIGDIKGDTRSLDNGSYSAGLKHLCKTASVAQPQAREVM